ncbi:hypothetical protein [Beijerinckia sp. L45]|uniref:hypothetical protein n=1 Tax=Beijerinckia sp. L45 TaxID=1641855 RepID=UPI00131CEE98|nr:hypothetical protein [Beijerinckia sp. L45]
MSDAAPGNFVLPTTMTPAIADVLGLTIMQTAQLGRMFRDAGFDIKPKVEAEQAFVLHRFLLLALQHGDRWREEASADIAAQINKIQLAKIQDTNPVAGEGEV